MKYKKKRMATGGPTDIGSIIQAGSGALGLIPGAQALAPIMAGFGALTSLATADTRKRHTYIAGSPGAYADGGMIFPEQMATGGHMRRRKKHETPTMLRNQPYVGPAQQPSSQPPLPQPQQPGGNPDDMTHLASGGGIHINPANKGKFNALKARTGKTTEELTHSKNPLTRKRAVSAQNAAS